MAVIQAYSDARAIRRVLKGQRDAFESLARRYYPTVYGLAYAQTGNWSDAEDVAQEALLRAYRKLDSLNEPRRFGPWLMRIVRNAAYDLHAKQRRDEQAAAHWDPPTIAAPDVETRELAEAVRRRVMDLDPGPREILLLRYFSGKSLRELAGMLQISPNAANKRLARARETLGKALLADIEGAADGETMRSRAARALAFVGASEGISTSQAAASQTAWLVGGGVAVLGALVLAGGVYLRSDAGAPNAGVRLERGVVADTPAIAPDAFAAAVMASDPRDGSAANVGADEVVFHNDLRTELAAARETGSVSGWVVDYDGAGLSGWTVQLRPDGNDVTFSDYIATSTDGGGAFAFRDLVSDGYIPIVRPSPDSRDSYSFTPVRVVDGGSVSDLEYVIDPRLRVWGRVTDTAGNPISGASVSVNGYNMRPLDMEPAEYEALYDAAWKSLPATAKLRAARDVSDYARGPRNVTGHTDADGRYALFSPAGFVTGAIIATAPRFMIGGISGVAPYGEYDIVLDRNPEIRGRVLDGRTGAPIPAFRLSFVGWRDGGADLSSKTAAKRVARADAYSDPDGAFAIKVGGSMLVQHPLAAAPESFEAAQHPRGYVLYTGAEGYAAIATPLYNVPPDSVIGNIVIRLEPTERIEGLVIDTEGAPIENARIRAGDVTGRNELATTGEDGRFYLDQTDPPLTALVASRIGFAPRWAAVENGRAEFVMDAGGELEVAILVGGRAPDSWTGFRVDTVFRGGEVRGYSWRNRPSLTIPRVSTDVIAVAATRRIEGGPMWDFDARSGEMIAVDERAEQSIRVERAVEILHDATTHVSFEFGGGYVGSLRGVVSVNSVPASGGEVAVTQPLANGDVLTTSTTILSDGAYAVQFIPNGSYELEVVAVGVGDGAALPAQYFSGRVSAEGETVRDIALVR